MEAITAVTRTLAFFLLTGLAAAPSFAADLSKPMTLVATPRLAQSAYAQTVLLAAPAADGMHVGIIVNRPTKLKLEALFPDHAPSSKVVDPVYFGGPALSGAVYAAVRTAPDNTKHFLKLMPDLVLVMDGNAVDRIVETTPNEARYFAGLVVWRPGELAHEIRAGAWQVKGADASNAFSANPEELWKSLSDGADGREAPVPGSGYFI
jgi:putative transcriptional regulator